MSLFNEMMDENGHLKDEIADLKKANEILHALLTSREAEIERLRAELVKTKSLKERG